ncbi:MAG: hypothetical protein QOF51_3857 [Chloroflexota bacterium]|nr:hypothetical protein [Chloroflexota bacterium]
MVEPQGKRVLLCPSREPGWAVVRAALADLPGVATVVVARNLLHAAQLAAASPPDAVLLAPPAVPAPSLEALAQMCQRPGRHCTVTVITAHFDLPQLLALRQAGVGGYLMWADLTPEVLDSLLIALVVGGLQGASRSVRLPEFGAASRLTEPEHRLLRYLGAGLTEEHIASLEHWSARTVRRMIARTKEKLDAPSLFVLGLAAARVALTSPAAAGRWAGSGLDERPEEQDRLLQRIAELTPVVLNVFDLELVRDVYISPDVVQLLGYTPEEILQLADPFATFWHPDDQPRALENLARGKAAADGEIREIEYRVRRRDGQWRWVMSRSLPFARDARGEVRQLVTASFDITERKLVEDRLAYQARILEHVQDAVVAADAELRVTLWNEAAEQLYGWTAVDVLGRDLREIVRSEYPVAQRAEGFRLLAETGVLRAEALHHRRDGTPIAVEGVIVAIRDRAAVVTGYVYVFRDVTARKRAEEAQQRLAVQRIDAHVQALDSLIQTLTGVAHAVQDPTGALHLELAAATTQLRELIDQGHTFIDEIRRQPNAFQ